MVPWMDLSGISGILLLFDSLFDGSRPKFLGTGRLSPRRTISWSNIKIPACPLAPSILTPSTYVSAPMDTREGVSVVHTQVGIDS